MERAEPGSRSSQRFNVSVPTADKSTLRWLEAQDNKSVSIRAVIRDYIERYGYTDPMCLPVTQGPRRGRPVSRPESGDVLIHDGFVESETVDVEDTSSTVSSADQDDSDVPDEKEQDSEAVVDPMELMRRASSSDGSSSSDMLSSLRD